MASWPDAMVIDTESGGIAGTPDNFVQQAPRHQMRP